MCSKHTWWNAADDRMLWLLLPPSIPHLLMSSQLQARGYILLDFFGLNADGLVCLIATAIRILLYVQGWPQLARSETAMCPGEWHVHPQVVALFWKRFGKVQVDLFASTRSTLKAGTGCTGHSWPHPLFCSWTTLVASSLSKPSVRNWQRFGTLCQVVRACRFGPSEWLSN